MRAVMATSPLTGHRSRQESGSKGTSETVHVRDRALASPVCIHFAFCAAVFLIEDPQCGQPMLLAPCVFCGGTDNDFPTLPPAEASDAEVHAQLLVVHLRGIDSVTCSCSAHHATRSFQGWHDTLHQFARKHTTRQNIDADRSRPTVRV